MGYLSSVRITMSEDAWKPFQMFVSQYLDNINSDDENLLNYININCYESKYDTRYIGWNWVKWYSDYDNVSAIEYAVRKIYDSEFSIAYVRIGEEFGDVEQLCNDKKYKGIDVEIPQVVVKFDDDYVKNYSSEVWEG